MFGNQTGDIADPAGQNHPLPDHQQGQNRQKCRVGKPGHDGCWPHHIVAVGIKKREEIEKQQQGRDQRHTGQFERNALQPV